MPLKLNKEKDQEGKWFVYSGDVELKIRPLLGTTLRELTLSAQSGRMVTDPRTKKMVPEVDPVKLDDLLTDYLIEDWRSIEDEQGNPLSATLESKKTLMNHVAVADFVWESARALDLVSERSKNS